MDDFSRVVQETSGGLLPVPAADGRSGGSKILRLRPNRGLPLTGSYLQTVEKNAQMWNECYTELAEQKMCSSPQFQVYCEQQVGLCWKESLECVSLQDSTTATTK